MITFPFYGDPAFDTLDLFPTQKKNIPFFQLYKFGAYYGVYDFI